MEISSNTALATPSSNREESLTITSASSSNVSPIAEPTEEEVQLAIQRQAVKQLARRYRGCTPALAFQSGEPSIFELIKQQGEDEVEAIFTLHLVALSRYLNLKAGLTEEQIDFVVEKLVTDYQWLKMADFAIVIDRIKSNYYGSFYENFSGQKFLDIMQQYDCERTSEIERIRDEENQSYRSTNTLYDQPIAEVAKLLDKWRVQSASAQAENNRKREADSIRREETKATIERISRDAKALSAHEGISFDEAYNRIMFQELDKNN